MTPRTAKSIIASEIARLGLSQAKLTARTINFVDLARDSCIFVKIHDWRPNPAWDALAATARSHGFRIEV